MLDGKAGLITGAADGIGRATAVAYAREGASVIVNDLAGRRADAEETVRLVREAGGRAEFVPADVAEEDFDRIMDVDVKGVWLCMKYQLRYMKEHGGGTIVNTSSEAGLVGTPLAGPYVAAKHAVIGLTRTAAGEYANMNIRVNAIAPGTIATPMVLALPQSGQDMLMAPQPLHRLGRPEEVAEAVVWLASDRASFVTGAVLCIDGGATSNAQSYDPELSPSP